MFNLAESLLKVSSPLTDSYLQIRVILTPFSHQSMPLQCSRYLGCKFLGKKRFGDVVISAHRKGIDCNLKIANARDYNDRCLSPKVDILAFMTDGLHLSKCNGFP